MLYFTIHEFRPARIFPNVLRSV